jgi:hypothetical protein
LLPRGDRTYAALGRRQRHTNDGGVEPVRYRATIAFLVLMLAAAATPAAAAKVVRGALLDNSNHTCSGQRVGMVKLKVKQGIATKATIIHKSGPPNLQYEVRHLVHLSTYLCDEHAGTANDILVGTLSTNAAGKGKFSFPIDDSLLPSTIDLRRAGGPDRTFDSFICPRGGCPDRPSAAGGQPTRRRSAGR